MTEPVVITEPGLYPGITDARYHEDPVIEPSLSCSIAQKLIRNSPAHAAVAHPRLSRFPQERHSERFDRGKAVHEMLVGGDGRFLVVDAEDWRGKEAKADRARAYAAGMTPLLARQWEEVRLIAEVVREQIDEHPDLAGLLDLATHREVTAAWREGRSGFFCRIRPDLAAPGLLLDFKLTGADATPEGWAQRTAFDLLYDFRAVFYLRGWKAVTGEDARYRFCVIEDEPPYALSLFEPTPEALDRASLAVDAALEIWERCLRTHVWPGYEARVQWMSPPTWAAYRWEAMIARAELCTGPTVREAASRKRQHLDPELVRKAIELHAPASPALYVPGE